MFHLAQTVWPRFGGDQANSSRSSIPGPHVAPTWLKISLIKHEPVRSREGEAIGGVIVMPDETLRVCHDNVLTAISLDGTIHWQLDLSRLIPKNWHCYSSLPTALQTGETLLVLPDTLLIVDRNGEIKSRVTELATLDTEQGHQKINDPDDSRYSPNLTYSGIPILSAIDGEVYFFKENLWHEIGAYGIDIVTPAVYPDNSLAIAGYAGRGFCRINLDGEILWKTALENADRLPTINHDQIAAIGDGLNSAFYKPDGTQVGEYNLGATFAEYTDGGWIALTEKRLARLTTDGRELWGCEIAVGKRFVFVEQPIVDRDGYIYIRHQGGYLCFDAHGHKVFEVPLPENPQGLMSIIAPGTMAHVVGDELFIGYS